MSAAGLAGVAGAQGGILDWFLGWDRSWTIIVPKVGWVLTGRAVFLATAAVTILLLAGIGVGLSGKAELRRRWVTWAIIIPAGVSAFILAFSRVTSLFLMFTISINTSRVLAFRAMLR